MKGGLAIHGGDPVRARPWPGWPQWDENERAGLLAVLERGEWGGYDAAVDEFERAFAARHAARFCVTTVNGTTTLETALRALCIGPGDEVIVPPYTFVATAAAVRTVGATPVFADVELETWNLSMPAVEAAISARTKAIIPVHFGGLPGRFRQPAATGRTQRSGGHRRRGPRPRQQLEWTARRRPRSGRLFQLSGEQKSDRRRGRRAADQRCGPGGAAVEYRQLWTTP